MSQWHIGPQQQVHDYTAFTQQPAVQPDAAKTSTPEEPVTREPAKTKGDYPVAVPHITIKELRSTGPWKTATENFKKAKNTEQDVHTIGLGTSGLARLGLSADTDKVSKWEDHEIQDALAKLSDEDLASMFSDWKKAVPEHMTTGTTAGGNVKLPGQGKVTLKSEPTGLTAKERLAHNALNGMFGGGAPAA